MEKYNLHDESNQVKLTFAVLTGVTALFLLRQKLKRSSKDEGDTKKPSIKTKKKTWRKAGKKTAVQQGLTHTESQFRKDVIRQVDYGLVFFIEPKTKTSYKGLASIQVNLDRKKLENQGPLYIDYQGRQISKLRINNVEIKEIEKLVNADKLELPTELLKEGPNTVEIHFKNKFSLNPLEGGLYLFNNGKSQYVYTLTNVANSHKIYPCFDQPSLKASYKLLIVAPENWKVYSNDNQVNIDDISSGFGAEMTSDLKQMLESIQTNWSLTAFDITSRVPPSSFGFIGGEFDSLVLDSENNGPSLSLNCRHALMKIMRVEGEDTFLILTNALLFFEGLFGHDYPYRKLDILFLPGLPEQATDLAGCCLVNEDLLISYEADLHSRLTRAVNILQQLAFSWIGHFVGTEWFKDKWLDQGLSYFLGYFALSMICRSVEGKFQKAHSFSEKDVWNHLTFLRSFNHLQGNLQVYYPMSMNVENVSEYESLNYEANRIRMAVAWRQFCFLVGDETFKEGVKKCFRNEGRFVNIEKFITTFETLLSRKSETDMGGGPNDSVLITNQFDINIFDLKQWVHDWVNTEGQNSCEIIWEKDNPMFNNMIRIKQTVESDGQEILRNHRVKIAFMDSEGQIFKFKNFLISNQEFTNLMLENPEQMPQAFFIDSEGNSTLSARIEKDSFNFFKKNISIITDALILSGIIQRTSYMVTIGACTVTDYVDFIVDLFNKRSGSLPVAILQQAILFTHFIIKNFAPISDQAQLNAKLFDTFYGLIGKEDLLFKTNQVIYNEIWRFVSNKDHIAKLTLIFKALLSEPEVHRSPLSLSNLYNSFRAFYLVKKDQKYFNYFLEFAQSNGFNSTLIEPFKVSFEEWMHPSLDKELALLKNIKKESRVVYNLEGVKEGVKRNPVVVNKKVLRVIAENGESWSLQTLLKTLELTVELYDDLQFKEEIVNEISNMKIKGKEECIQIWQKMKLDELNKKKMAFRAVE